MKATGDTIIGDILDWDEGCAGILASFEMHCTGCPAAHGETVDEACEIHGVEPVQLLEKLNGRLADK